MRAKLSNPTETRFLNSVGEWMIANSVSLDDEWRGKTKLKKMAAIAILECLRDVPRGEWQRIPLLLCIAEQERIGRIERIDNELIPEIELEIGVSFSQKSIAIPRGRVGICTALLQAREMINQGGVTQVLVAATDSLLNWATLSSLQQAGRLITTKNSNGLIPGEGAAALLIEPGQRGTHLICEGLGFGNEAACISSEKPLRGVGLAHAIRSALVEAEWHMHEVDYRIGDMSGEQYYFKEAALALSRTLRRRKPEFDIWQPSECVGETGAVVGLTSVILADAAIRKGYAPGSRVLCHFSNDSGQRAAAVFRFGLQ
jgi:3-oxoacyl-[acyl-carrier-protein] synthase-1